MDISISSIDIHQEVAKRNIDRIYTFIQEGNDLNSRDDDGNTPIHIAAANGYEDIVDLLIDYEVDHDASNLFGWTPIMQAVRNGHQKIIEMLIESGADVNLTNNYGVSLLTLASASGNTAIFKYLYSEVMCCEDDTNESQEPGNSPLAVAALFGNYGIVNYLLKSVDVNALSFKIGVSPLMCAAAGGDFYTVKLLLNQGADPSLKNCGNYSALDFAPTHNYEIIVPLQKKNRHSIFEAIVNGNEINVKVLLDVNPRLVQEVDGLVPLLVAAEQNSIPMAKLLLHYDADVNVQHGTTGWTPIMYAVYNENVKMIKLLLNSGADLINIKNSSGNSAFDIANENKSLKILQLLSSYQKKFASSEKYDPRSDFVHRQVLKFKEFKRKLFKKNSSTFSSTDPSNETYRVHSSSFIPQSTFSVKTDSDKEYQYSTVKTDSDKGYQYSILENASAPLANTPKSKCTIDFMDGNAKGGTFTSKCNRNSIHRHSLPATDLHKNNYQKSPKIPESFSSPNIVGKSTPDTEYDDIATIHKRIEQRRKLKEPPLIPSSYYECACMRRASKGQESMRNLNEMCSPSVVNRQVSEYDSI